MGRLFLVAAAAMLAPAASPAASVAPMTVTSPAFAAGSAIPRRYSAYGENRSPPVRWTPALGARAYVVIMDDPDAHGRTPFVHWILWNIPGSATSVPEGVAAGVAGVNGTGRRGYFGPRPPSGVHHYHLRVFALDAPLGLAPGADRAGLARAMNGHVIGAGEMVATYAASTR